MSLQPIRHGKKFKPYFARIEGSKWGEKPKKGFRLGLPNKKAVLLGVILFIAICLVIPPQWLGTRIVSVQASAFNNTSQYNHTRAVIYRDTNSVGVTDRYSFNSTCVSYDSANTRWVFNYSIGASIGANSVMDSYSESNQDATYFITTTDPSLSSDDSRIAQMFTASFTGTIDSAQFFLKKTGSPIGNMEASVWSINGTYGSTAEPLTKLAASSLVNASSLSTSYSLVTFNFTSVGGNIILTSGNQYAIALRAPLTGFGTVSGVNRIDAGADQSSPSHGGNGASFRNSLTTGWTTVDTGSTTDFIFYVRGRGNHLGVNCASANILGFKIPVNLQAVSDSQLEMANAWSYAVASVSNYVYEFDLVFRTNETLPSFREDWNPFNDRDARMIWTLCPSSHTSCGSGTGNQTLYIARDFGKSISEETFVNDRVLQITNAESGNTNTIYMQIVLNFTGPTHWMLNKQVATATTTTQTSVTGLQHGIDYFVFVRPRFNVTNTPAGSQAVRWQLGAVAGTPGGTSESFGLYAVPAVCYDPVNKNTAFCNVAPPTGYTGLDLGEFDLFKPQTWVNAIIKGIQWVFLVAVPSGLAVSILVTLQFLEDGLNALGNFFGWGNIGTSFTSLISSLVSLILQLPTSLGWVSAIINRGIDIITFISTLSATIFGGVAGWTTSAKNIAGAIVTVLGYAIFVTPVAIMTMDFVFYFVFITQDGLGGLGMWARWNKWLGFGFMNLAARITNILVSIVSWLIGRIPTFSGTHLPRFPLLHPGEIPSFKLDFGTPALRKGDPFSVILLVGGATAFVIWLGSGTGPFSATVQGQISPLQNLFLPFVTMAFILMISVLPVELMRRLMGSD